MKKQLIPGHIFLTKQDIPGWFVLKKQFPGNRVIVPEDNIITYLEQDPEDADYHTFLYNSKKICILAGFLLPKFLTVLKSGD
jgi:hypothetical protein